jgi:hypothetical protein
LREDGPRHQGIVAITGPTAVGWKMPLVTEHTPLSVPTGRAREAIRVEMLCEPTRANAVIQ